jgi:hypothetical protein
MPRSSEATVLERIEVCGFPGIWTILASPRTSNNYTNGRNLAPVATHSPKPTIAPHAHRLTRARTARTPKANKTGPTNRAIITVHAPADVNVCPASLNTTAPNAIRKL